MVDRLKVSATTTKTGYYHALLSANKRHIPQRKEISMDYTMIYSIYSEAMDWGKITALKIFLNTFMKYPPIGIFFTCLILRRPTRAAAEFIKRFV